MAERIRRDISSGDVYTTEFYYVEQVRNLKTSTLRPRFKNEDERILHRTNMSRKNFTKLVNTNFTPQGIFWTLTFDDSHLPENLEEAVKIRDKVWKKIRRNYPDGKIIWVMGYGKESKRLHFHVLTEKILPKYIKEIWTYGEIRRNDHLREHNYYEDSNGNRIDFGRDYTGLANYLFGHWTEKLRPVCKHHYKASRNLQKPDTAKEEAKPIKINRYSKERPPKPPVGYKYVDFHYTKYGYMEFKYVRDRNLHDDLLHDTRAVYKPPEIYGDGEFLR